MKCAVVNCNKSNKGKASVCSFFRFPLDGTLRKKWISACGGKIFNPNTSVVCMHHFKEEDFGNNLQYEMGFAKKRLLKDGVAPTINIAYIKNYDLHETQSKTVNFLFNNQSYGLMPSQEENDIFPPNEYYEIKIENIDEIEEHQSEKHSDDIKTENIDEIEGHQPEKQSDDIKMENMDEIERHQLEKQSEENISSDVSGFHNLNLKMEALEKEIIFLRKEKKINDAALIMMKDEMEKMDKTHIKEKEQMAKCLAKAKFELACVEEKLQVIFTKGQIRKLKNGIKRQTWSEDDIAHCVTLYDVSPKMYKLLYKKQFPLPAVRTLQSWAQKFANH